MSTDQPTLQEFGGAEFRSRRRREIILAEGGVYGRDRSQAHEPDAPEGVCLNCGKEIAPGVGRVMGDNDGNVECCADCRIGPGNEPYERDASALQKYRAGVGQWQDGGEA